MSEELAERYVQMLDDDSGETLSMQVVAEIEYDDKTYALLIPAITLVQVLVESDDELRELETSEFAAVSKHINDAIKDWGLTIEVQANEYVLVGEEPDDLYEDCDSFVDEEEDEEYFILTEVSTGETTYLVSVKAVPNMFPAELIDADNARSLNDEEMGRLHDVFQEAIKVLDEDEGDDE